MFRKFRIKINDKSYIVEFEKYKNLAKLGNEKKELLKKEINSILVDGWGRFPEDFVKICDA